MSEKRECILEHGKKVCGKDDIGQGMQSFQGNPVGRVPEEEIFQYHAPPSLCLLIDQIHYRPRELTDMMWVNILSQRIGSRKMRSRSK